MADQPAAQFQHYSEQNITYAKSKLKDFFLQFLSQPETQMQINSFIDLKLNSENEETNLNEKSMVEKA